MILNLTGHGSVVADITNLIFTPFQRFADILKNSFSGYSAYLTEFNRMKEEIADLKEKLETAQAMNEDSRKLREENENLYSFYGLKRQHTEYELQPAKITARGDGNYLSSLTINKGSFHNIEKDMPVIASKPSASGAGYDYTVVGYVSEVGLMSSKVVPFIRTGTYIGAYIGRTEETGIVEGDFELEKDGLCRIASLSKEAVVEAGDKIYSSGSGIYPENLYIGEVTEVEADPLSRTVTGRIEPDVNFNEIKDVMVILKFERKFY
jgi:rod shape-determining protein MreC